MQHRDNISHRQTLLPLQMRGFTLLEVLVVLFVIGIIVSFASLSVGQNTSRVIADEAGRLHALIKLGSEEAVLQGSELALQFDREGYGFMVLAGNNEWLPLDDDNLLRHRSVPEGVLMDLELEGTPVKLTDPENPARILILSSGEITPFALTVRSDDGDRYQVDGSLDGKVAIRNMRDDEDT